MVRVTENGVPLYRRGYGRVQPYNRGKLAVTRGGQADTLAWLRAGMNAGTKAAHWIVKKIEGKKYNPAAWKRAMKAQDQLLSGDFKGLGQSIWDAPRVQSLRNSLSDRLGFSHTPRLRGTKMDLSELEGGPSIGSRPTSRMDISRGSQLKTMGKRFYTSGNHGGRFGGRKLRKLSKSLYQGAVIKYETNGDINDADCIYCGVVSHPIQRTLQALGYAIARLCAKFWKQDVNDMNDRINHIDAVPGCSLRVTMTYRNSVGGPLVDDTWTTSNTTYAALGDNIIHHLMQNCANTSVYFEVYKLKFANIDATAVESLQTLVFSMKDMKISIYGKGIMKLQNLTVSSVGDAVANEQEDDIANNPLRGKKYTGRGQTHRFRFYDDYSLAPTVSQLQYTPDTGVFFTGANAANLTANQTAQLKKPPHHKTLTYLNSSTYVRLAPGEIKNLVVKASYTKTFNGWVRWLLPVLRSNGSFSFSGSDAFDISLGKNASVALEHEMKAGTEPNVNVAIQTDHTLSAIAYYKHSVPVNVANNPAIASKIISE